MLATKPSAVDTALYLTFGITATVFGVIIYYFMPSAMLHYDYANIARIFMLILIGLVVGLCLLAFNLQILMEGVIIRVYMMFE